MPCNLHFVPQGMDKVTYKKGTGAAYVIQSDGDSIERISGLDEVEVPFFMLEHAVPYTLQVGDIKEAFALTWEASIGRLCKCTAALSRTFNESEGGGRNPAHMDLFIAATYPYLHTWGNTKADRVAPYDPFEQKVQTRVILGGTDALPLRPTPPPRCQQQAVRQPQLRPVLRHLQQLPR